MWLVVCDVGFLNEEIKEVKVDADSGNFFRVHRCRLRLKMQKMMQTNLH